MHLVCASNVHVLIYWKDKNENPVTSILLSPLSPAKVSNEKVQAS
jgi:hypothetical protein